MAEDNGKAVPWWVTLIGTVGIPGFIALYLLGAVPGMPSPIDKAIDKLEQATDAVNTDHKEITSVLWRLKSTQERMLEAQRATCRGVWKGNLDMQAACDGRPEWRVQ